MHRLSKGANAPLTADALSVEIAWDTARGPADLDVSALLLDDRGRVADDHDFVFFNAPRHRSGAVVLDSLQPSGRRSVAVDLRRVPKEVQVVALVISADGAAIADGCRIVCTALGAAGRPLCEYALVGTTTETAVLLMELYRRDGAWKIRAVGQGWDAGLAALATEFGVVVDDPGDAAPPGGPVPAAPAGPVELARGGSTTLPCADVLAVSLSWEVLRAGRLVPLDADAVLTDRRGHVVGTVGTRGGDAVAGVRLEIGSPTQNGFAVRLTEIAPEVAAIVFTMTSFGGQRFTEIAWAAFELSAPGTTVRGAFTERERRTGLALVRIERGDAGSWRAVAIGEHADARRGVELVRG